MELTENDLKNLKIVLDTYKSIGVKKLSIYNISIYEVGNNVVRIDIKNEKKTS